MQSTVHTSKYEPVAVLIINKQCICNLYEQSYSPSIFINIKFEKIQQDQPPYTLLVTQITESLKSGLVQQHNTINRHMNMEFLKKIVNLSITKLGSFNFINLQGSHCI